MRRRQRQGYSGVPVKPARVLVLIEDGPFGGRSWLYSDRMEIEMEASSDVMHSAFSMLPVERMRETRVVITLRNPSAIAGAVKPRAWMPRSVREAEQFTKRAEKKAAAKRERQRKREEKRQAAAARLRRQQPAVWDDADDDGDWESGQ